MQGINIRIGHNTDAACFNIRFMIQTAVGIIFRVHHTQHIFQDTDIREQFRRYMADVKDETQIPYPIGENIMEQ